MSVRAIVIGASAGAIETLIQLLQPLPSSYRVPIIIVCHLPASEGDNMLSIVLARHCQLQVKEACERETLCSGTIYIAPPSYHLLLEKDLTLALSLDDKVLCCRPSIDVLFMSAADALEEELLGILLTGANADGADGLVAIKQRGGQVFVQDPVTATVDVMPRAALMALKKSHLSADAVENTQGLTRRLLSQL